MTTPLVNAENLAKNLTIPALYFKREDLHPYGSHKGRSIPKMIEKYAKEGWKGFTVSSSGNAALAAALYIKERNLKNPQDKLRLKIYIGYGIDKEKMTKLLQTTNIGIVEKIKNFFLRVKPEIKVQQTLNPKQSAFLYEKSGRGKNLRQSADDTALLGYGELARELAAIKDLSSVFIPTSSGTTAQGLFEEFQKMNLHPKIFVVQTTACHSFSDQNIINEPSFAKAIVDKTAKRKEKIKELLQLSGGKALIINNSELLEAEKIYHAHYPNEKPSYNSLLSLAGLTQELKNGTNFTGSVVCLFTGK